MNWYYAVNKEQKGPVSPQELLHLAAAGVIYDDTLVWNPSLAGWQPYGTIKGTLGGAPVPPTLNAPQGGGLHAAPTPDWERLSKEWYDFRIGEAIDKGWNLFKSQPLLCIGATFVTILLMALASGVLGIIPILGPLMNIGVSNAFFAGLIGFFLLLAAGEVPAFSVIFSGFRRIVPLFLAGLVSLLLICIGIVLLIIPGIYLSVAYTFTIPLMVDQGMDFWQAMETSRKVVTKRWFKVATFGLVLGLLNLLGLICLGVGLFVTLPISYAALCWVYRRIFTERLPA